MKDLQCRPKIPKVSGPWGSPAQQPDHKNQSTVTTTEISTDPQGWKLDASVTRPGVCTHDQIAPTPLATTMTKFSESTP